MISAKRIERWVKDIKPEVIGGTCPERLGPLMTRWVLFKCPLFRIMIHKFHRSDYDRAFHDHPWNFITFLLTAGYYENTPQGRFYRHRFSLLYRPAAWLHWVELECFPVYTLVIRFRTIRDWGFIVDGIWKKWNMVNFEAICEEEKTREL